jgi:hypothetical protein
MLRPGGLIKLKRQFDSDDVDMDSGVQYFIDKRLRLSPSGRNYVRTKSHIENKVLVILCVSGGEREG